MQGSKLFTYTDEIITNIEFHVVEWFTCVVILSVGNAIVGIS